ncbi:hypothetical protein [Halobellus litoreus]|nr:hypothetical protein [Halobellus litoreus]
MPRPQLDEDTYDRLAALVDARTKVPAEHLTTDDKITFLLDALDEADTHIERLSARVDSLEDELEDARAATDSDSGPAPGLDEIAGGDLGLANDLGRSRRR